MRRRSRHGALSRPASLLSLGVIAATVPTVPLSAQTTVPSISVTAGGAYSSNPFLSENSTDAISTQLDIRPQVQFIDGVTQATIGANYNRADYVTGGLGGNDGYGVSASAGTQLSPRTTLNAALLFDSQILGAGNGFLLPSAVTAPVVGVPTGTVGGTGTGAADPATAPVVTTPILGTPGVAVPVVGGVNGDVGLIGLRQRRNTFQAQFGGSYLPSTRSTWSFGLSGARSAYPGNSATQLSNYTSYGANIAYSRTLSELSSGGAQLSVSKVDYTRGISSQIYTPRLTYSRRLSVLWSMTAAVGAGIVRDDASGTNVSVSIDGSLCRTGERGQGCIVASRSPSATGLGGVSVQSGLGLTYSQRLAESLSFGLGGQYTHVDGGVVRTGDDLFDAGSQNLYSADASLQRQLGRRLSLIGQVSYRHVNSSFAKGSDIGARLGLSWSASRR